MRLTVPSLTARLREGVVFFGLSFLMFVSLGAAVDTSTADARWHEIESEGLLERGFPPDTQDASIGVKVRAFEKRAVARMVKGLAFYQDFPTDVRRWAIVLAMVQNPPRFITNYGGNIDHDWNDVQVDEAAAKEWKVRLNGLEAAMKRAPDVPADVRERMAAEELQKDFNFLISAFAANKEIDWDRYEKLVWDLGVCYPEGEYAPGFAKILGFYLSQIRSESELIAYWERMAHNPNRRLAQMGALTAAAQRRLLVQKSTPWELKFTAVDGRQVDLRELRGKVVLIDFWATWCRPCMDEMPHVRKAYNDFRSHGFEVIGINCDWTPDTELTGAVAQRARSAAQVLEFTRKENMPWPHYYLGQRRASGFNDLGARLGVTFIPQTFLLDQNGLLYASGLRGEELLKAIHELLEKGAIKR